MRTVVTPSDASVTALRASRCPCDCALPAGVILRWRGDGKAQARAWSGGASAADRDRPVCVAGASVPTASAASASSEVVLVPRSVVVVGGVDVDGRSPADGEIAEVGTRPISRANRAPVA
jgi:hypothetical protein